MSIKYYVVLHGVCRSVALVIMLRLPLTVFLLKIDLCISIDSGWE